MATRVDPHRGVEMTMFVHQAEPAGHRVVFGREIEDLGQRLEDARDPAKGVPVADDDEDDEPDVPARVFVKVATPEEVLNQTGRAALAIVRRLGWPWRVNYSASHVLLQAGDGVHGLLMLWKGKSKLTFKTGWIWEPLCTNGSREIMANLKARELMQ